MKLGPCIGLITLITMIPAVADKSYLVDKSPALTTKELSGQGSQNKKLAKDFFALIDINSAGMEKVRKYLHINDYNKALDAYRDNFVKRASGIKLSKSPNFWLWGKTDPNALLKEGEVGTSHYGDFHITTRYVIGYPGNVNWHLIPASGYDTVLRDLPTMHWASTLADAYDRTKNPEYLAVWSGYWADFAENWLNDHNKILNDPNYKDRVNGTIHWAGDSILYHGWRLQNYFSWLFIAASDSESDCCKQFDSIELASVLKYFAEFEIPRALVTSETGERLPNQIVICALGMMQANVAMRDFKNADEWEKRIEKIIDTYIEGSGYLPDGSDMEQSLNYNTILAETADNFIEMAQYPPFLTQKEMWGSRFDQMKKYRLNFMSSLTIPDGRAPSIGTENNFVASIGGSDEKGSDILYSRQAKIDKYRKPSCPVFRLEDKIFNQILGDKSLPEPGFTSIYFPYGGFVIMRNGWEPTSHYAFMKTSRPAAEGHFREGGNGLVIHAFGEYLLVNSSAKAYSNRGAFNLYFHSTLSQNSISVDGYSQLLRKPSNGGEVPRKYTKTIPACWHTSSNFDFAEGLFRGNYGGYNYLTNQPKEIKGTNPEEDVHVTGVKHDRQVFFLRKFGIWIVTDILQSQDKHFYSQSWNFSPAFAEDDAFIKPADKYIGTCSLDYPNLCLRHFTSSELTYKKYYGIANESATLGWVAIERSPGVFTPAVDVHVNWQGKGDQLLVTTIEPMEETDSTVEKAVDTGNGLVKGFRLEMKDGRAIMYQASLDKTLLNAGTVSANAKTLLVTIDSQKVIHGIALDCSELFLNGREQTISDKNFEFSLIKDKFTVSPIIIPSSFKWIETKKGELPVYE